MNFGKLFIVGFEGTSLSKETKKKLEKIQPAGIILYDSNIEEKEQVQKLIKDLKNLLGDDLIITVDQEGGKVERLRKICTSLPSFWALGKAAKEEEKFLKKHSEVIAKEMLELGFNFTLAPCVDLCTNHKNPIIGSRSLGSDAQTVSNQLKTILDTYQSLGLASCAKHFPGHGDASLDSHFELPKIKYDTAHLEPFKAAIEQDVSSVMMGHLLIPELDSEPASLSKKIIQEELRNKLSFQGLIISDEMTMQAVCKLDSPGITSQKAIEAGCNLLIWNTNIEDPLRALEELDQISSSSQDLIDAYNDSTKRIQEFKSQYIKESTNLELDFRDYIDHHHEMLKIVTNAMEWHKDPETIKAGFQDLSHSNTAILAFNHPKLEEEAIIETMILPVFKINENKAEQELQILKAKLSNFKNLIIFSFQTTNYPNQKEIIKQLKEDSSKNILQCSTDLPDEGAELDLYGANKIHLEALLRQLKN